MTTITHSVITMKHNRLLMCAPDAYGLKYEINAWMDMDNQPDLALAAEQWAELHRVLTQNLGVQVELIHQSENAPDMVFTANAGLVSGNRVLLSRFRHPERQLEVAPFRAWFEAHGYEAIEPPNDTNFEGEGDALFVGDTLVAGYLKRTDIGSHRWISEQLGIQVLSVELVDGRWYHLDTAFFALNPETIVAYEGAFDTYAWAVLKANFDVIEVCHPEALQFACNSIVLGQHIVMPSRCPKLAGILQKRGYEIHPVPMTEFLKSGGACKCLALFLPT
jgi:N-dimethylarginine dimethylaminohydrolase